ncbi:MAG TPA: cupin domain-containing protein [Gaiellaceae bacterium]
MTDWSVRSVRDLSWRENGTGVYCDLLQGGDDAAEQFAINLNVLERGQPMALYHHEPHQEGFLVLRGECELIVEGSSQTLRQWDYFHCPVGVPHVIVGAGDESALVLAVGSRVGGGGATYPPDQLAARYGASTDDEHDARSAYAKFGPGVDVSFREEFVA